MRTKTISKNNKNSRKFSSSLSPSVGSDALITTSENADLSTEQERQQRRIEKVRKELTITQKGFIAGPKKLPTRKDPEMDGEDLERTWYGDRVSPLTRRNELTKLYKKYNDVRDKQARSVGGEMEGMAPDLNQSVIQDLEYYEYSPSDDEILLALSDRYRGTNSSNSLREERELISLDNKFLNQCDWRTYRWIFVDELIRYQSTSKGISKCQL